MIVVRLESSPSFLFEVSVGVDDGSNWIDVPEIELKSKRRVVGASVVTSLSLESWMGVTGLANSIFLLEEPSSITEGCIDFVEIDVIRFESALVLAENVLVASVTTLTVVGLDSNSLALEISVEVWYCSVLGIVAAKELESRRTVVRISLVTSRSLVLSVVVVGLGDSELSKTPEVCV